MAGRLLPGAFLAPAHRVSLPPLGPDAPQPGSWACSRPGEGDRPPPPNARRPQSWTKGLEFPGRQRPRLSPRAAGSGWREVAAKIPDVHLAKEGARGPGPAARWLTAWLGTRHTHREDLGILGGRVWKKGGQVSAGTFLPRPVSLRPPGPEQG